MASLLPGGTKEESPHPARRSYGGVFLSVLFVRSRFLTTVGSGLKGRMKGAASGCCPQSRGRKRSGLF